MDDLTRGLIRRHDGLPRLPRWFADARCADADPDLFDSAVNADAAKAICARCPVAERCLDYALEEVDPLIGAAERFGIFGGLTGRERAAVVEAQQAAA